MAFKKVFKHAVIIYWLISYDISTLVGYLMPNPLYTYQIGFVNK